MHLKILVNIVTRERERDCEAGFSQTVPCEHYKNT